MGALKSWRLYMAAYKYAVPTLAFTASSGHQKAKRKNVLKVRFSCKFEEHLSAVRRLSGNRSYLRRGVSELKSIRVCRSTMKPLMLEIFRLIAEAAMFDLAELREYDILEQTGGHHWYDPATKNVI